MTKIKLPPISDEDRQHLSYNPNTDDLVEWVESQMYAAVAAALAQQAARHAEELDAYALTVSNLRREQGEPVAWGMPDACGNIVDTVTALDKTGEMKAWEAQYSVPLYTAAPAPEPERKPMTDWDIDSLQEEHMKARALFAVRAFTRAIEAHHGIKEKP